MEIRDRRRYAWSMQMSVGVLLCIAMSLWRANHVVPKRNVKTTKSRDFWLPQQPMYKIENERLEQYTASSRYLNGKYKKENASDGLKDLVFNNNDTLIVDTKQTIYINSTDWNSQKTQWHNDRPSIKSLIKDNREGIIGDVRPLLDVAILGHAKCATSFLTKWLAVHPQVQIWKYEVCILSNAEPARLVRKLYDELPLGGQYHRAFKCPVHFGRRTLQYFRSYFNKTRIIVGVRHPVKWFESYYNFRVRHKIGNSPNWTMPAPNLLIGKCLPESHGVCTDRAKFHVNMAMFGKTNMSNPLEKSLLRLKDESIVRVNNSVFMYDVSQLYDDNPQRQAQFKRDLQDFLGLTTPFPEAPPAVKTVKPDTGTINICDDEFIDLRQELLTIGKRASIWIRHFFLQSDQVYVSDKEYFEEILKQWKDDPCLLKQIQTSTQ